MSQSNEENDTKDQQDINTNDNIHEPNRRHANDWQNFLLPSAKPKSSKLVVEYVPKNGVTRYHHALRNLIPVRYEKVDRESMPADSAGLFSYIFFTWMTPYIWKGYKKGIKLKDIPQISPYETCKYNTHRLEILWQEELGRQGPSLASFPKVAWRFVRTRVFAAWFLLACSTICGFISPMILMRKLLEHIQSPHEDVWDGIKWAVLLTLCDFTRTLFFTWTWCTNIRTGLRLKAACTSLLYKKIVRLNSLENRCSGEIINLFSNDSQRLFDTVIYGPMIIAGPLAITFGVVYILWIFNPLALLGITAFMAFYPCQYLISRVVGYFRSKTVVITDARVKLMNEILECIKMIKMCSWEKYFSRNLLDIRKQEQRWLHKTAYFQSLSISLTPAVPVISAIITFLSHLSSGSNLTAAQVFPFVSLLNTQIRTSFMFLQVALVSIAESKITLNRLKRVMLLEESTCHISKPIVKSQAVGIANGTFVYGNPAPTDNNSKNTNKLKKKEDLPNTQYQAEFQKLTDTSKELQCMEVLMDIKFEAAKGELVGICGQVGSGKTSLLLAALGQLKLKSGHISREGSCAYVSQQAWIVNTTLKENILFGEQFDAKRYYQAVTICNLKEDINMLPGGDGTEIGERGVNLSGGQKQRVALARAFYANKNIYFLDDPLSAVDAHVGAYIFEHLILGALKNKCVILVTHQVQFLQHCDQVYLMHGGKIIEQGIHTELMNSNGEYSTMVNSACLEPANNELRGKQLNDDTPPDNEISMPNTSLGGTTSSPETFENGDVPKKEDTEGATLTVEEKVETGTVKCFTYHTYIKAAGGYLVAVFVFFTLFLSVGSSAFSTWWLAMWIKAGGGNITDPQTNETLISDNINDNPHMSYYQDIYASCIGAILLTSILRGLVITFTTISASTALHNKVFKKMMASSLTFFETTPGGRIQNIFSRDIDEVDNYLPISIENMIQNIFTCSFAIIVICSVVPWFAIPLLVLAAIFLYVSKVFRVAMRDFKRMESTSRSPVLSFVTTTVQGLNTIHAFQKEKDFLHKFEDLFDLNTLCLYMCQSAMRWSAVRLDSLAIVSSSITAFLVIALKDQLPPALAGLAMAYATQMSGVFQYTVRLMSETETRFISVERISYYLKTLEKEGTTEKILAKPPNSWPNRGKIEFRKVELKYRKELSPVLHDINFSITAGEKIGIVGRTGSGKSSLAVALFRLVELSGGKIKIDSIDISKVDLETLRTKMSIIPQDPVLFSGTVRANLDPFTQHNDSEIWDALEKTQLKPKVQSMTGQLEAVVSAGSLSVGERQLLCLTRALLRSSKILVLDEATAAVDPETELAVQATIQNEFANYTVLTIAHRLKTVVNCDRIMVMSAGRILEFDTPAVLLSNPDSEFARMMARAEKSMSEL